MILRYEAGPDMDLAVAGMWSRIKAEGDLETIFPRDGQGLSDMYRLLTGPNKGMFFEADSVLGIWVAIWYEQVMGVLYIGVWVARDRRHRRALKTILHIFEIALKSFPAMLAVTKQRSIVHLFGRLGGEMLGEVPGMWDGEPAYLLMVTRQGFLAANADRLAALRLEPTLEEVAGGRADG